jgi:hypothetical protein
MCPYCESKNEREAQICTFCGRKLPTAPSEPAVTKPKIGRATWLKYAEILLSVLIVVIIVANLISRKDGSSRTPPPSPPPKILLTVLAADRVHFPLDSVQVMIGQSSDTTAYYTGKDGKVVVDLKSISGGSSGVGDTIHVSVTRKDYKVVSVDPPLVVVRQMQENYFQTFAMERVRAPVAGIVEFSFRDETGAFVRDVVARRNNLPLGSIQGGRFTDTLATLTISYAYEFAPEAYYEPVTFTLSPNNIGITPVQKEIRFRRFLFSIRCVDTTGIHTDQLDGITVSEVGGKTLGLTDRSGWLRGVPLRRQRVFLKLSFYKQDVFPQQEHAVIASRNEEVEVDLHLRSGSLSLTVKGSDGSIVPYAKVTLEGNGFRESRTANELGRVRFTDPRIMPGKYFEVQVGSQELSMRLVEWDTEREFTVSSGP